MLSPTCRRITKLLNILTQRFWKSRMMQLDERPRCTTRPQTNDPFCLPIKQGFPIDNIVHHVAKTLSSNYDVVFYLKMFTYHLHNHEP